MEAVQGIAAEIKVLEIAVKTIQGSLDDEIETESETSKVYK